MRSGPGDCGGEYRRRDHLGQTPLRPLDGQTLERDLQQAYAWSRDIYIFSLEGCMTQGFLSRIAEFNWHHKVERPQAKLCSRPKFFGKVCSAYFGWAAALILSRWLGAYPRHKQAFGGLKGNLVDKVQT